MPADAPGDVLWYRVSGHRLSLMRHGPCTYGNSVDRLAGVTALCILMSGWINNEPVLVTVACPSGLPGPRLH